MRGRAMVVQMSSLRAETKRFSRTNNEKTVDFGQLTDLTPVLTR
jgi:hypothetical protein